MRKLLFILPIILLASDTDVSLQITRSLSIDSLGACQGVSFQNGRLFLYGDRETGVIREYKIDSDSLKSIGLEMKLTVKNKDLINHPTGIAYNGKDPVFIGNSIRLNNEGTLWKAVIYCVDWEGLQSKGTLDGNILNTIEDDACIQGTRPEYVKHNNKWYVATADYGAKGNEVRLYDPELLAKTKKTSEPGVVVKKFTCSPWVQNLAYLEEKNLLVLIQNIIEGRQWRFTFVDLEKSIAEGKEHVIKSIDVDQRKDELEGFCFLEKHNKGIAVSSSRKDNVNIMAIKW